jgi:hypothetical protein
VYTLAKDGTLRRALGSPVKNLSVVDERIKTFQAIDPEIVYTLGIEGQLHRTGWPADVQIKVDIDKFRVVSSMTLFVLGKDGILWRVTTSGNSVSLPVQIDRAVLDFDAIDPDTILVLDKEGTANINRAGTQRIKVDDHVSSVQAIGTKLLIVLDRNGNLWEEDGDPNKIGSRFLIDTHVQKFQPLAANLCFVLNSDGNLWREWWEPASGSR